MFRTKINVFDAIAVFLVLCVACILLWVSIQSSEDGAFLVVTTEEGSAEYSLSVKREITVTAGEHVLTVMIENGEAFVKESDCPDKICVTSGKISRNGETVICAPAGVRLLIKGRNSDVDYVAG